MTINDNLQNFIQVVNRLDLKTQHLSINLTAKAKPSFLSRLFDFGYGAEKLAVARNVSQFIETHREALEGFKNSSPAEFALFRTKLDTLSGKLKSSTRIDFGAKLNNLSLPFSRANGSASSATVSAPVSKPAPITVATGPDITKAVQQDKENIPPKAAEPTGEQILRSFGAEVSKKLAGYGNKILSKVVTQYKQEILSGVEIHKKQLGAQGVLRAAEQFYADAVVDSIGSAGVKRLQAYDTAMATKVTDQFRDQILKGKKITPDQIERAIASIAITAFTSGVVDTLLKNYGQEVASETIVKLSKEIGRNERLKPQQIYAVANNYLIDEFIARRLPKGTSIKDALQVLFPKQGISEGFIQSFRLGEFSIGQPGAIDALPAALKAKHGK